MKRALAAAVGGLMLRSAAADAQGVPGTADDPAETLAIEPAVVDVPLGPLSIRGAPEADTAIYLDGFELPRLRHVLGLRTVVPWQVLENGYLASEPDVTVGRPSAVILSLKPQFGPNELEASTLELAARTSRAAARMSVVDPVIDAGYRDAQFRIDSSAGPWRAYVSTAFAQDKSTRDEEDTKSDFGRLVLGTEYAAETWTTTAAVSVLTAHEQRVRSADQHLHANRLSFDSRIESSRTWRTLAGLSYVKLRVGEQTNLGRHDLDVAYPRRSREGSPQPEHPASDDTADTFAGTFWTPDAAVFADMVASLSHAVHVTTGLRVDLFGRGRDIATEPRGELLLDVGPQTWLGIGAGAYRRAAEQGEELFTDRLNPERTTQLMVRVEHLHQALKVQSSAYYVDRSRLVIRDDAGVLRNSGIGTAYGVEGSAQLKIRGLLVRVTAALSRSMRRDFLRAAERPSEFDQPLRTNALFTYRTGPWQLGARVQVGSGLPTTAIQQSVYDADHDAYVPIFDRTYGERMPWRAELDMRVDRDIRIARTVRLHAFVDLALSPSTIGYHYSDDYKQRTPIREPIVPFVGLRGTL